MDTLKLVLLRHGRSLWRLEKRFSGWPDVELITLDQRKPAQYGRFRLKGGYLIQDLMDENEPGFIKGGTGQLLWRNFAGRDLQYQLPLETST